MDVCMGEPVRMGGGCGSGIPKPTAVVKSYSKPTHQVAPLPPRPPSPPSPPPEKIQVDDSRVEEVKPLEEEDEAGESIKPMEPLFRGYRAPAQVPPSSTIPYDRSKGYRPLGAFPVRSSTETNFVEADYSNISVSSGYLSDSDMRHHSRNCDIPDGYMSESGTAALYQRLQDQRGIPSVNNFGKFDQLSYHHSKLSTCRVPESSNKVSDETVDLSSSESSNSKGVRVVNGNGGGGRGVETPAPPHQVIYRVVGSRNIKKADSSQQTDNTAFRQVNAGQWKGVGVNGRSGETDPRGREKKSPNQSTNGVIRKGEKKRLTSSGSREELDLDFCNGGAKNGMTNGASCGGTKGVKVRTSSGVPPTYGYVKRPSSNGTKEPRSASQGPPNPRTKVKVSGGTQTEAGYSSRGPALGSVGKMGPAPSGGIGSNVTASGRMLTEMGHDYSELASPYSTAWLRHGPPYPASATHSLPTRTSASGVLLEAESIESLPAQLQHRSSLTHARVLGPASTAPRLSRSNSIRSTKSEKVYPSMLQRSEEPEPYYSIPYSLGVGHSQPTSPTPSQMSQGTAASHGSRFNYPISPISGSPSSHTMGRNTQYGVPKMTSKDDDAHGSAVSLVSTTSSLYSTPEEKQAHEVRKLRKELSDAHDKVQTLTHQLSTNAHVVSAFEQSLSNMTQRLQQLAASSEKKDSEMMELKQTIELLRRQSMEAGLTGGSNGCIGNGNGGSPPLSRRHTVSSSEPDAPISRQLSTDSVSSLSSNCSLSTHHNSQDPCDKKKKRGWLRSSFNKAFSRTKKNKTSSSSMSVDGEDCRIVASDASAPSSPLLGHGMIIRSQDASPTSDPSQLGEKEGGELVEDLKKQLREKDLVLTDIRLEALSSAHQLESLKDTVIKMKNEMVNLKQDNERLQRLVTSKSLTSSQTSIPSNDTLERRFSMNDAHLTGGDVKYDVFAGDPDGKRVTVEVEAVGSGRDGAFSGTPIATVSVSGKTKWDMLDAILRKVFKDYLERVDPGGSLGLTPESLESYQIGEVVRGREARLPELLPCGYLVGDTSSISLRLRGPTQSASMDALAFQTLIPKSIVQRYISLLTEYRRIILCGPSGTGKTYLANRLAEFLAMRAGKDSMAEAIATFNVECKSSKELRQYLTNVAEQCETGSGSELPLVIILDNLHQAASLQEVFSGFLSARAARAPYIIGTMNQATCSTTNLQLHHNFRWILCANHMEPVKGFLGRYLRRRLIESECRCPQGRSLELARVIDWIPRVWAHLNSFLESHSSSDVTIGPRLFLSCPMEPSGSQVWFTDLWNYSVVPYVVEAVREGLAVYGRRAAWTDPAHYLLQTYPWSSAPDSLSSSLIRLRPEDVGYDPHALTPAPLAPPLASTKPADTTDGDPLMNMLMRLQEAANYSGPQTTDSDSNAENGDSNAADSSL